MSAKKLDLLKAEQAAEYIGKTPAAFRAGYKKWGIPYIKLGGQLRWTYEILDDWIKINTSKRNLNYETNDRS